MRFTRVLVVGLGVSLLAHGAGSAYFAKDPNEVEIAASKGGAVSVIGSLEDLVAGEKVDAVEPEKPVEEVEPVEEAVEQVREVEKLKPLETVQERVEAVQPLKNIQPVKNQLPVTAAAVKPVPPVEKAVEAVQTVKPSDTVPLVQGVTSVERVTEPVEKTEIIPEKAAPVIQPAKQVEQIPQDTVPAKPVIEKVETVQTPQVEPAKPLEPEPQTPVQLAKAVVPEAQPVEEAVRPETDVLETLPEPVEDAVRVPVAKPEPPVRKAEPVKKKKPKKQKTKRPQKRGAEANARKGGEKVTSKTARSNANGRADARTNDGGTKAKSNYKGRVVAKLRRAKRYPKEAKRKKLTGTVRVSFTISKNGSVSGIRISRSSGHGILDQAALDMVRRASPMPKFPGDIKQAKMTLHVPVRFD